MTKITFQNAAGDTVDYFLSSYKMVDYKGFDAEIELNGTDVPFGDGQMIDTERVPKRAISVNLNLLGNSYLGIRDTLLRPLKKLHAKNSIGFGKLICQVGTTVYYINVKPENVVEDNELGSGNQYLRVRCDYRAFDPWFYDFTATTLNLVSNVAGFDIPMDLPWGGGATGDTRSILNDGDVDMPFLLTITGYVDTPILIDNTHGFIIQYDGIVGTGETLVIDTTIGNPTATLTDAFGNSTNVLDKINDDSFIFQFEVGTTSITYWDIFTSGTPTVALTYRRMYNGI
jgi:hypothetical protein